MGFLAPEPAPHTPPQSTLPALFPGAGRNVFASASIHFGNFSNPGRLLSKVSNNRKKTYSSDNFTIFAVKSNRANQEFKKRQQMNSKLKVRAMGYYMGDHPGGNLIKTYAPPYPMT